MSIGDTGVAPCSHRQGNLLLCKFVFLLGTNRESLKVFGILLAIWMLSRLQLLQHEYMLIIDPSLQCYCIYLLERFYIDLDLKRIVGR